MKRFYFGSEDEGDEEDAESFEMPSPAEIIAMTQMESPFRNLMDSAMRVCERSLVWRFTPPEEKLKTIKMVFDGLAAIEREYEKNADLRDEL
jgi:hypothetical protein